MVGAFFMKNRKGGKVNRKAAFGGEEE